MRWHVVAVVLLFGLSACASKPERRNKEANQEKSHQSADATQNSASAAFTDNKTDPCSPIHDHDEKHYTAGGLYAPHLSDSAPASAIDVGKLIEPLPKTEPLARYGNKSPYTVLGKRYEVLSNRNAENYSEHGIASWYGQKFNGRKTSSGEIYSICEFTAAHKTLPLPSYVRVTNKRNGQSVIVRVNDRGPFHEGRIIDLSYVAAVRIGLDKTGTAPVHVEVIGNGENKPYATATRSDERTLTSAKPSLLLQFGSFGTKDNAKRLQNRLLAARIDNIELDEAEVQGQSVWRVQLRDIKNEQLDALFEKIQAMGLPKPKVVTQKL